MGDDPTAARGGDAAAGAGTVAGGVPAASGASTAGGASAAGGVPAASGASANPRGKYRATIPAIDCRGLSKRYGPITAVSSLSLTIGRGEIFGLLGPNGAGKTTTILMVLGLTEPTGGSVRVLGLDPAHHALEIKSRVGYLPDAVGFYPTMTARQNLRYTARLNGLRGSAIDERVTEVLETVGLTARADDRAGTFSRGMGQRLGIADALIKSPDVLILDEPTAGLDPQAADRVLATITALARDSNVTVLLSSHLLGQVQAICHRIGIFVRGSLVAAGTIDELAARHGGRMAVEVVTSAGDPSAILRDIDGVVSVQPEHFPDGDGVLVGTQRDIRREIATAVSAAGLTVVHLRQRAEELGTIYRRYFSEAHDDAA